MNRIIPQFKGKIYPDNTFSVWRKFQERKRKDDGHYDRAWTEQHDSYVDVHRDYGGVEIQRVTWLDGRAHKNRFINAQQLSQRKKGNEENPANLLDDSDADGVGTSYKKTQTKSSTRYGSNGITKYGRKAITCIATLLQEEFGRERLGFGTATLPGMGRYALQAIMGQWATVVKRFFEGLRRICAGKGHEFHFASCTEIQEGRFTRTGVPAFHLHWVYVCRDRRGGEFYISANQIRRTWQRVLFNVLRGSYSELELGDLETGASVDCTVVRKSAAAYLGKYISKGVKALEAMKEAGWDCYPAQWWSASHGCKRRFKGSIRTMSAQAAEMIFYNYAAMVSSGHIIAAHPHYINLEIGEICVAICGTLSKYGVQSLPLDKAPLPPHAPWG